MVGGRRVICGASFSVRGFWEAGELLVTGMGLTVVAAGCGGLRSRVRDVGWPGRDHTSCRVEWTWVGGRKCRLGCSGCSGLGVVGGLCRSWSEVVGCPGESEWGEMGMAVEGGCLSV